MSIPVAFYPCAGRQHVVFGVFGREDRVAASEQREVERLVAAERAAKVAGQHVARWWREMAANAASARTDEALDDLFRGSLATIKEALDADAVSVLVANDAEDELVARASNGLSEEVTLGLAIHRGEGMAGRVLATRAPLFVEDLSEIQVVSPVLRNSGLRSVVAVPIRVSDRILGVLYTGSYQLGHFSRTDLELLELIAERFADAMERVDAFESERSARARIERDADHLNRLQKITSRLLSVTTTEEIAANLTDALATDSAGTEIAWSSLWLGHGRRLILVPTPRGIPLSNSLTEISIDDDGPISRTFRDRCANYSPQDAEDAQDGDDAQLLYTSWAAIPLVVRQECIGVVVQAHRQNHAFEQDERDFLNAMADQAAQAIERARLYAAQVALAETNAFFAQAARVIAEGTGYTDTLARLASLALHVAGDICLIDVVDEEGGISRMIARHRDETQQQLVDRLLTEFPPDPLGTHPAVEVIRAGKTQWSEEMPESFLRETTRDDSHLEVVTSLNFKSFVAVPLIGEAEVIGAITLVSTTRVLGPVDVSFAERLAEHVAAVVDNARLYESAEQTSHTLQQSLLPRDLRSMPGLEVVTRYLPATRGLEIGGDFYDLVVLPSGDVGFMIGDVAGHDREAAAMMGQLRSAARALAGQVATPSALIAALQWSWELLGFDRIATGVFCRLEPGTRQLKIASAGHYPPLLVEPGSASFIPVSPAKPFGSKASQAEDWMGTLGADQLLVLYTDGAIDEREAGPQASMDRLADIAAACGTTDPQVVCEHIIDALPFERLDDVALLALRFDI
jgi:GAF domain-containing protein